MLYKDKEFVFKLLVVGIVPCALDEGMSAFVSKLGNSASTVLSSGD